MSDLEFVRLGPGDYDRAKKVLNAARHPGFVGRELYFRCATSGSVCIAVVDGLDAGVGMVNKNRLLVLSVDKKAQGKGVGQAIMRHMSPRFVTAIYERVGFFAKLGYVAVGAPKIGQNGKHATQLMELPGGAEISAPTLAEASEPIKHTPHLIEWSREMVPASQLEAELLLLDELLGKARGEGNYDACLKIMARARQLLRG